MYKVENASHSFLRLAFFAPPAMFKIYDKLGKMHNKPPLFIALDRINFTPLSFECERYKQQLINFIEPYWPAEPDLAS